MSRLPLLDGRRAPGHRGGAATINLTPTVGIPSGVKTSEDYEDYIYFQGSAVNTRDTGVSTSADPILSYTDSRVLPVLDDCSKWKMSIIRATIDNGADLPYFLAQIRGGAAQTDNNLMIQSVSLRAFWQGSVAAYTNVTIDGTNNAFVVSAYDTTLEKSPIVQYQIVNIPAAVYTRAALAAAVQAAIQALGGVFALATAVVLANGKMQITPGGTPGVLIGIDYSAPVAVIPAAVRAANARVMGGIDGTKYEANIANPAVGFVFPNAILNPATYALTTSPVFSCTVPLTWIPQDQANDTIPLPPSMNGGRQDLKTNPYYYFCYDPLWVIKLFNTAFETCYTQAVTGLDAQFAAWWAATFPGVTFPGWRTKAPFITFDASTQLFTISFDKYGYTSDTTSADSFGLISPSSQESFQAFMNSNAFQMFRSWPCLSLPVAAPEIDFLVLIAGAKDGSLPDGTSAWAVTQTFKSLDGGWSPISSVVFTTNSIPCVATQLGAVTAYGADTLTSATSSSSGFGNVITDVSLAGFGADSYRGTLQYSPTGQYRYLSMGTAAIPLYSVQISVWWKDKFGNLIPYQIPQGGWADILIQFAKIKA